MEQLTTEFEKFFIFLAKENWGTWLSAHNWPKLNTSYSAYMKEQSGVTATFIRFDSEVTSTSREVGKLFIVRPISNRKPNGQFIKTRF